MTPPPCGRYDCAGLPPHTHVLVAFPAHLVTRMSEHVRIATADIDRVWVDWRKVAYELQTGHQMPPPAGQLSFEVGRG
jgi:hypothetical protein